MKKCTKCNQTKSLLEFPFRYKEKGILKTICKECQAVSRRAFYDNNKEKELRNGKKSTKTRRLNNRKFLFEYLSTHPCSCGESNPVLLEFDHRDRSEKRQSVSTMTTLGLSTIKREIEKCDVLCVRCHRLKTAEQFGWYKDLT